VYWNICGKLRGTWNRANQHLANQRALVGKLERQGSDPREARRLLSTFEDLQAAYTADLERIRGEWADLDKKSH
jgi:hypothetical protein